MEDMKQKLASLSDEAIIELAEGVLHESILIIRRLAFELLPMKQHSAESHHFYTKLLIKLSDNIHNLPTYIKQKKIKWLRIELSYTMNCIKDYFLTHTFLLNSLYAYRLVDLFTKKDIDFS